MEQIINQIPEYGKDIKINIQTLISEQNQILSLKQIYGIALACAFATKNLHLIQDMQNEVQKFLSDAEINAVKIASTIMAMNNIYYRFSHLTEDKEYSQMQTGLRMRMLLDHKIEKIDFEFFSLAVSIINGCGMCIDAHANQLIKHGITKTQIQMVAKISAVINGFAQILTIENL